MSEIVNHWIDGKIYESKSGRTAPVYDPALGIETKKVALANKTEIDAAIAAAKNAFRPWADTSLAKRQQIKLMRNDLLSPKINDAEITKRRGET